MESDLYKGKRKVRKRVLTEKEKLMEVGLKLWMVSHFYWLNTNFFFGEELFVVVEGFILDVKISN